MEIFTGRGRLVYSFAVGAFFRASRSATASQYRFAVVGLAGVPRFASISCSSPLVYFIATFDRPASLEDPANLV